MYRQMLWAYGLIDRLRRKLKVSLVKRTFAKYGRNFRFDPDSTFFNPQFMEFGDDVFIGLGAHFGTTKGLRVGNGVMFGPFPMIVGGDHNIREIGKRMCDVHADGLNYVTTIADDVWIGARVTLLKGVSIGEGAVIGAGSLVTRSVPPYTIATGVPCRPVRTRFSRTDLKEHLRAVGSQCSWEAIIREWEGCGIREAEIPLRTASTL